MQKLTGKITAKVTCKVTGLVEWPRGEARDCKSLYTGSNPVSTSSRFNCGRFASAPTRTIGSAVEHFLDMEGVTGSIPVSSTKTMEFEIER